MGFKNLYNKLFEEIRRLARPVVNGFLNKQRPEIQAVVRKILVEKLESDPTILSLLQGQLKTDFGLTNQMAEDAVLAISHELNESTEVIIQKNPLRFNSLYISIKPNIPKISDIPEGRFFSEGRKAGEVEWLYWLLNRGTEVVVANFEVIPTVQYQPTSRTGFTLMIETGQDFRVDPKFAGTEKDNFITRLIEEATPDIIKYVNSSLSSKV